MLLQDDLHTHVTCTNPTRSRTTHAPAPTPTPIPTPTHHTPTPTHHPTPTPTLPHPQCPGLFDIFCVLRTGCWRNLFTTLITIAFVVLFLVAVVFMVRKGWCIMLMPVKGRKGKGKKVRGGQGYC